MSNRFEILVEGIDDASLVSDVETAIRERRSVVDVMEPLAESVTALPWATPAPRRVGSVLFYQAAVLHSLNGNRDRAILRTKDWLDALSATDHAARADVEEIRSAAERATSVARRPAQK